MQARCSDSEPLVSTAKESNALLPCISDMCNIGHKKKYCAHKRWKGNWRKSLLKKMTLLKLELGLLARPEFLRFCFIFFFFFDRGSRSLMTLESNRQYLLIPLKLILRKAILSLSSYFRVLLLLFLLASSPAVCHLQDSVFFNSLLMSFFKNAYAMGLAAEFVTRHSLRRLVK